MTDNFEAAYCRHVCILLITIQLERISVGNLVGEKGNGSYT